MESGQKLLRLMCKPRRNVNSRSVKDFALLHLPKFLNGFCRLEMFARIFALGFWRGETAYLRNNYNRLDFLVVISSCALKVVAWDNIYQPIYPGDLA